MDSLEAIENLKKWAEQLDKINQLSPEDYEKFQKAYKQIMWFDQLSGAIESMLNRAKRIKPLLDSMTPEELVSVLTAFKRIQHIDYMELD